jgi:hypothetical protein
MRAPTPARGQLEPITGEVAVSPTGEDADTAARGIARHLAHERSALFQPNSGSAARVDKSTLGDYPPDDIFGLIIGAIPHHLETQPGPVLNLYLRRSGSFCVVIPEIDILASGAAHAQAPWR